MTNESILDSQWYWDRRNRKAYFPREQSGGNIEFVTIWHAEEIADALEGGALVPLDEIDLDKKDTTFDLLESFRFLPNLESSKNVTKPLPNSRCENDCRD